jgi:hypothetical protein
MSVTGHIILADWPLLERRWHADPDSLCHGEPLWEGWPEGSEPESWDPDNWIDSWNAAAEVGWAYERLRKDLDPPTREAFDRVLGAFSLWDYPAEPPDLPGFEPGEPIARIFSPRTVERLSAIAEPLDLEALCQPYARRPRPSWAVNWFPAFEEFRDYLRQWFDMLRAASASGKAVILYVA